MNSSWKLICGDCLDILKTLDDQSVQCCITSPPYFGLRDYGVVGQIGLEQSVDEYINKLVIVFQEVKRILKNNGTLWLNLGDSYNGSGKGGQSSEKRSKNWQPNYPRRGTFSGNGIKPKDLIGIPWMVAFALRADGWYLRSDIIWNKLNPMPESVKDRPTKSHEYIFLLTKQEHYYYDYEAILEPANYDGRKDTQFKGSIKYDDETLARVGGERWPNKIRGLKTKNSELDNNYHRNNVKLTYGLDGNGFSGHSGNYDQSGKSLLYDIDGIPARNKRDVWTVATKPFKEAHFAVYPQELILPCVLAGSKRGDTILDPFNGSGTTGVVCIKNDRNYIGIDLNQNYITMSENRLKKASQQLKFDFEEEQ